MSFLKIENLRKSFGANQVVEHFDLSVARGEFVSFLGPSGCGKTTTLRMVAGFETPTSGSIKIDGQEVTHLRPNQRKVGMVFQSYALFPNMTVAQNVAFGLKVANRPAAEVAARVEEMLNLIKLPKLGGRYPFQLSGGQQQRVALARALAIKPQVLLLDEPLSALDAKIRVSLREEIRAVQRQLGITTVYVTDDQKEALSMSDRIVVMNEGRVEQIGQPFEIYNHPRTRFVASFVGTLNILKGKIVDAAGGASKSTDRRSSPRAAFPTAAPARAARSRCGRRRRRWRIAATAPTGCAGRSRKSVSWDRWSASACASRTTLSRSTPSITRAWRRPSAASRPMSLSRAKTCWS
ncbi:MAG TPA: ABC transporter ATP-binding protein [Dongiaceae bacterium]